MKKTAIFNAFVLLVCLIIFLPGLAKSSELIFQFTNPSFGGNPLNGSFLLEQAKQQNKFKEKTEAPSLINQLTPMYQAQYLTKILDDVYEGKEIQEGRYIIGGLIVDVTKGTGKVTLLVTDPATGQQTTFELPYNPTP